MKSKGSSIKFKPLQFTFNSQASIFSSKRSWYLDLFILTLFCVGFFGLFLGSYPLIDPDEGRYSDVTRHMVLTGHFLMPMLNGIPFFDKPILFYWLQSIPVLIFRVINEWTLRTWPAIAATLTCLYTYITARKCFNRRTAWFASLILATSSLFFLMAHFANLDLTVALFISLSLFSFLLFIQNQFRSQKLWYGSGDRHRRLQYPTNGHSTRSGEFEQQLQQNFVSQREPLRYRGIFLWLAYVFAGLAILTKGLIGIAFPIMIIGLWILLLKHWKIMRKMHFFSGFVIIAVIVLPWFVIMEHQYRDFFHYFFYTQQVHRFLAHRFNDHEKIWFYPELIFLGIFPWTIYFIFSLINNIKQVWKNRFRQQTHLFLLIWIISITVFFSIPSSKTAGYILPIFPAAALLTASYLDQCWAGSLFSNRFMIFSTAIFLLLLAVILPFITYFNVHLIPVRNELDLAAFILLVSAIGLFVYSFQAKLVHAIVFTGITGIALFVIFMFSMAYQAQNLGIRSSKPLAMRLKPTLKPTDVVVFYHFYYQDLPIYLNRQILLVEGKSTNGNQDNWRHDFYQGLKYQKFQKISLSQIRLNNSRFAKLWQSKKTVYAFTMQSKLSDLEKNVKNPIHIIGRYAKLILISNHLLK